jgi:hypothetical protein
MGFNTVAVLYNDCTHEFEKDGPLGQRIANAMRGYHSRDRDRLATWFGAGQVISQAHADYYQITAIGKNGGCDIREARGLDWMALEAMADCLKRHGYTVKLPTKRKKATSGPLSATQPRWRT